MFIETRFIGISAKLIDHGESETFMWNRQSTQTADSFRKQPKKDSRRGRPSSKRPKMLKNRLLLIQLRYPGALKTDKKLSRIMTGTLEIMEFKILHRHQAILLKVTIKMLCSKPQFKTDALFFACF